MTVVDTGSGRRGANAGAVEHISSPHPEGRRRHPEARALADHARALRGGVGKTQQGVRRVEGGHILTIAGKKKKASQGHFPASARRLRLSRAGFHPDQLTSCRTGLWSRVHPPAEEGKRVRCLERHRTIAEPRRSRSCRSRRSARRSTPSASQTRSSSRGRRLGTEQWCSAGCAATRAGLRLPPAARFRLTPLADLLDGVSLSPGHGPFRRHVRTGRADGCSLTGWVLSSIHGMRAMGSLTCASLQVKSPSSMPKPLAKALVSSPHRPPEWLSTGPLFLT